MSASRADRQPIRHRPSPRLQRGTPLATVATAYRYRNRTVHPKNSNPLNVKRNSCQPRKDALQVADPCRDNRRRFRSQGQSEQGREAGSGHRGSYNNHASSGPSPYENTADPRSRSAKPISLKSYPHFYLKMDHKKSPIRRVRLEHTLRQRELLRAEAVWQRSTDYRRYLVVVYTLAFLSLFHFLSGSSFFAQVLHDCQDGWRAFRAH